MKNFLISLILISGLGVLGAIGKTNNLKSQSKNIAPTYSERLTLKQLYRLADSVRRDRNKGKTTMWVDERPHSYTKIYSKTMWIEDSFIGQNNMSKYRTDNKYKKAKKR